MRTLLAVLALASFAAAQELDVVEGLRPFRHPSQDVQVPEELFRNLQVLFNISEHPEGHAITVNDQGREVCDHPTWQQKYDEVKRQLFNMATVFGLVLRDSSHVNDRTLAAYGTFLLDDPQPICELIAFLPGEPEREIREPALRRAIEFLRVQLPKNTDVVTGNGEPPAQPKARYSIDLGPYFALLAVDDYRDQVQAMWFLAELAQIRPETGPMILHYSKKHLREHLGSERELLRTQARTLLERADPKHRKPPAADADRAAVLAWLDEVLYEVFPPIRAVSDGLTDLYPGADLDEIVAVGRDALSREAIGEPFSGKLKSGVFYRGFRVARLPEPLDKLRIPVGAVITNVCGRPVATGAEIVQALERWLAKRDDVIVEYAWNGDTRVMEYRLRSS
jgi:hypothetical protein